MNKVVRFIIMLIGIGLLITACAGGAAQPAPTEAPAAAEEVATTAAPAVTEEAAPTEAPAATGEVAATEAPAVTEEAAATEAPATAEEAATTEASATAKILRIRLPNEPQNGDPAFWIGPEEPIMLSVYEGLVSYKPGTWEVVNTLAESITPSEDGLKVEFKLKEGVQFHGGYGEVTAEDVKFSFERIAGLTDPPLESPYSGDWVALDHVEVTGDYTGEIILKEPFAALWTTTLPQSSGFILSKKAVEELGDDYATHPIGTGPYELVEWVTNERYVLKRFADYSGNNLAYADPVEWDEIHELPIIEYNPGEIALETGELDFSEILPESLERFEADDRFEVHERTTLDYLWIGMNVNHPKLQDINVRQAIRYAIDIPSIIDAAYDGKYARACALVVPGQLGEWTDAPCYERDLDKAREFMAMAGLETLDLTIRANENEDRRTIAEIVQANLAEIGINVEIEILDDAAMTDAHFGDTGFNEAELFVVNFITNPDPSWSTVWFLCDQVKVWNWMQYCSEEYDQLHFAALKEQDPAKRAEMYIEMQKIWDEAVHSVWIAYPILYWASRADIEPSLMPHGRILAWNFRSK